MRLGKRAVRSALVVAVLIALVLAATRERTGSSVRSFSVWDEGAVDKNIAGDLQRGQWVTGCEQPDKSVNAYPRLKSDRPLYGSIRFDRVTNPETGPLFHFVLDESGGPGKGYDRLYFDANRDGDLTNDAPLGLMEEPPRSRKLTGRQVLDYLDVPIDHGPGVGSRPLRILPSFKISTSGGKTYASVNFVAAVAHKGTIRIGSRRYRAVLGQSGIIVGRFDRPYASLSLTPLDPTEKAEEWWDADRLYAMHRVDGAWYRVSATPTGDALFVKPYEGDFGVFELGPGRREITALHMWGSLQSTDMAVPVGKLSKKESQPEKVRRCELPVGDYTVTFMHVEFGRLSIEVSENYHADGKRLGGWEEPHVYGVKIRRDKPFVLDFSNTPEVMFTSPAKEQTFKPGDEVKVAAVMIDPVLNVMIREIKTTEPPRAEPRRASNDAQKAGDKTPDKPATPPPPRSLDPTVTIADSSGKEVARGTMPFGWDGTCGYSWRVPKDIKTNGKQETFTATVVYNTRELYGTVKASRTFTVTAE